MTYGQVKRAALRLINADTIDGTEIPPSYNGQADLLAAMPSLVDDAMMEIATTVRKIPACVCLDSLEKTQHGSCVLYTLPEDCWQLPSGGLFRPGAEGRCTDARLAGGKLLLPAGEQGLWMEYWRYPASVGEHPADDTPLDNSPDTHSAVPYFVAAQLVLYDDAYRFAALHNEWETRLARLNSGVFAESVRVGDRYEGFGCDQF